MSRGLGIELLLCVGLLVGLAYNDYSNCYPMVTKTIVEVGGCDETSITSYGSTVARGNCGVKYNDGTFGQQHLPVVGKQVQVCK